MVSTRAKLLVVGLLYFAEGLPFGLINSALSIYFRDKKITLEEIGFLSLLGLAWSVKIFWAPLVDRFGQRYFWIIPAQSAIALFSVLLAFLDPVSDKALFWLVLFGICLASATQDIAIDAYTIDILEERELGLANGIRSGAYRVALITSGGLLVMVSDHLGWSLTFISMAVIMGVVILTILSFASCRQLRPMAKAKLPLLSQWMEPIKRLFLRRNFCIAVAFVLLYKVGEAMAVAMANPFWIDRGFRPGEIGFVVGTLGMVASIGGALTGGALTTHWGIIRSLLILGAIQALASLGYALAALPFVPPSSIYFVALFESLAIGLATAAFLSFLMRLCDKAFSATHYAFLSMLFGLGRSLAGVLSGYAASSLGYAAFFAVTFFAALPALFFIPWLPPAMAEEAAFSSRPSPDKT